MAHGRRMRMSAEKVSVLIVDDNRMDAMLVQQMLKSLSGQWQTSSACAADAEQALAELTRRPYDLVLLDYQLPGASGLDVLKRIRSLPAAHRSAVVMLTASGSEAVAVEAMKHGAKDYLRKDLLDPTTLGRAVTTALAQKRLEEQVAAFNAQRAEDLSMARELQRALMPQSFPCFPPAIRPEESALRFWGRYLPTSDLGGDFFDVIALSDTEAGVLICDVMGHGVRAALVMAMIRAIVEELRPVLSDPARAMDGLNAGLLGILRQTGKPLFATALYMVVDVRRMEVRYARAGHPEPFLISTSSQCVSRLPFLPSQSGPALGLFADAAYATAAQPLEPGDTLILYTDGLAEATNAGGFEYGAERLGELMEQRMGLPCDRIFDDLLADVRRFAGQDAFADDVCLVGVDVVRRISS